MKRITWIFTFVICSCLFTPWVHASTSVNRVDVSLVRPANRLQLFKQLAGVWGRLEVLEVIDDGTLKPRTFTGLVISAEEHGLVFKVGASEQKRVFVWSRLVSFTNLESEALDDHGKVALALRRVVMRNGAEYTGYLAERTPTVLKLVTQGGTTIELMRAQILTVSVLRNGATKQMPLKAPQPVTRPGTAVEDKDDALRAEIDELAAAFRQRTAEKRKRRASSASKPRKVRQSRRSVAYSGQGYPSKRPEKRPKRPDGTYSRDPNRTRYVFSPSARTLKSGEGYVSQKQLLMTEIGVAVHDNVTLAVGGVLPSWFAPKGFNMVFGTKFGLELTEGLDWAAGIYGVAVPGFMFRNTDFAGGGIAFTTLTFGSEDFHGSVSAGAPFVFGAHEAFFDPVLVVSGNFRLSETFALVTENWILPSLLAQDGNALAGLVNTACGRYIADGWAMDFGLIRIHGLPDDVPLLPWLDFTWHWGD